MATTESDLPGVYSQDHVIKAVKTRSREGEEEQTNSPYGLPHHPVFLGIDWTFFHTPFANVKQCVLLKMEHHFVNFPGQRLIDGKLATDGEYWYCHGMVPFLSYNERMLLPCATWTKFDRKNAEIIQRCSNYRYCGVAWGEGTCTNVDMTRFTTDPVYKHQTLDELISQGGANSVIHGTGPFRGNIRSPKEIDADPNAPATSKEFQFARFRLFWALVSAQVGEKVFDTWFERNDMPKWRDPPGPPHRIRYDENGRIMPPKNAKEEIDKAESEGMVGKA